MMKSVCHFFSITLLLHCLVCDVSGSAFCENDEPIKSTKMIDVPDMGTVRCDDARLAPYFQTVESELSDGVRNISACGREITVGEDTMPLVNILNVGRLCCDTPTLMCSPTKMCATPSDFVSDIVVHYADSEDQDPHNTTCADIGTQLLMFGGDCSARRQGASAQEPNVGQQLLSAAVLGCCGSTMSTVCGQPASMCKDPTVLEPNIVVDNDDEGRDTTCAMIAGRFVTMDGNCSAVLGGGGGGFVYTMKHQVQTAALHGCCGATMETTCGNVESICRDPADFKIDLVIGYDEQSKEDITCERSASLLMFADGDCNAQNVRASVLDGATNGCCGDDMQTVCGDAKFFCESKEDFNASLRYDPHDPSKTCAGLQQAFSSLGYDCKAKYGPGTLADYVAYGVSQGCCGGGGGSDVRSVCDGPGTTFESYRELFCSHPSLFTPNAKVTSIPGQPSCGQVAAQYGSSYINRTIYPSTCSLSPGQNQPRLSDIIVGGGDFCCDDGCLNTFCGTGPNTTLPSDPVCDATKIYLENIIDYPAFVSSVTGDIVIWANEQGACVNTGDDINGNYPNSSTCYEACETKFAAEAKTLFSVSFNEARDGDPSECFCVEEGDCGCLTDVGRRTMLVSKPVLAKANNLLGCPCVAADYSACLRDTTTPQPTTTTTQFDQRSICKVDAGFKPDLSYATTGGTTYCSSVLAAFKASGYNCDAPAGQDGYLMSDHINYAVGQGCCGSSMATACGVGSTYTSPESLFCSDPSLFLPTKQVQGQQGGTTCSQVAQSYANGLLDTPIYKSMCGLPSPNSTIPLSNIIIGGGSFCCKDGCMNTLCGVGDNETVPNSQTCADTTTPLHDVDSFPTFVSASTNEVVIAEHRGQCADADDLSSSMSFSSAETCYDACESMFTTAQKAWLGATYHAPDNGRPGECICVEECTCLSGNEESRLMIASAKLAARNNTLGCPCIAADFSQCAVATSASPLPTVSSSLSMSVAPHTGSTKMIAMTTVSGATHAPTATHSPTATTSPTHSPSTLPTTSPSLSPTTVSTQVPSTTAAATTAGIDASQSSQALESGTLAAIAVGAVVGIAIIIVIVVVVAKGACGSNKGKGETTNAHTGVANPTYQIA